MTMRDYDPNAAAEFVPDIGYVSVMAPNGVAISCARHFYLDQMKEQVGELLDAGLEPERDFRITWLLHSDPEFQIEMEEFIRERGREAFEGFMGSACCFSPISGLDAADVLGAEAYL